MPQQLPGDLINFLKKPESYPHKPERVKHIQTHISHVFIAPPYVYKFKKPVDLDFLDFSSPDKRKYYCYQEVKLNRRLCEGLYLGVVPVYKSRTGWTFSKNTGKEPAEYAVRMKQLSKENFLIDYLIQGTLTYGHLDRVADRLVSFYKSQSPAEEIQKWGSPEKIKVNTDENFKQTRSFTGETISRNSYDAIRMFTNLYLDRQKHFFEKRIREGHIVDGHGDLHLEHIHFSGQQVCIYDCIEFNDRFRYQDIASDIAFLAMDLDFRGFPKESGYFIRRMSDKLDDRDLLQITDFYKCYRAYIRGKVKSMESREEEVAPSDRNSAEQLASRYFTLSLRYALFGSQPKVLVLMGRVACGKSTLSDKIAGELGIHWYSSDYVRKNLAGQPLKIRTPSSGIEQVYGEEMSQRTYKELFNLAKSEVEKGRTVLLDATFGKPENREKLVSRFNKAGTGIYFIEVEAPDNIRKKRLKQREKLINVISDARADNLEMIDNLYHPPLEIDPACLIKIRTDIPVRQSISNLFRKLIEQQFQK